MKDGAMTSGVPGWAGRFYLPRFTFPMWARDAPDVLLYASTASGRWQLVRHDLQTGMSEAITCAPAGVRLGAIGVKGDTIWWFDDPHAGEVGRWRVASADGETLPVAVAAVGYPTGIALGDTVTLLGFSTDTGSAVYRTNASGEMAVIYRDTQHSVVGQLSADEVLLSLAHSRHGDSRHPAIAILDKDGQIVAEQWDGHQSRLQMGDWSPVTGDQRIIVHHERLGYSRPAVWSPLTSELTILEVALEGDVYATWFPSGQELLLRERFRGRDQLYRRPLNGTSAIERITTPAGSITAAQVRPDGQLWAMHSSGSSPESLLGAPILYQRTTPYPRRVNASYHDVDADGVHGFVVLPRDGLPAPTLMMLHGGPGAHDSDSFSAEVQAWVDSGFAVATVNYRGSTGYGQQWRRAIRLPPGPGLGELEDIAKVRHKLIADRLSDPLRMVVSGRSWGGYLTLLALGLQPGLWSAGIANMPVADWFATYEDELEVTRAHDRALFGGSPGELPDYFAERNPLTFADRVLAPVLIVLSSNDPHCPRRQIDRYVAALQANGKVFAVHECAIGHAARVVDDQVAIQTAQIDFALGHIKSTRPTKTRGWEESV